MLHQGAAAESRGCEVLVRAMAGVPGAHLVFLGSVEPDVGEAIRREAAAVGGGRVHFAGAAPLDRLLATTAEADVGVSLLQDTCENHRLALPNKLFEYVAAGVPVVVSDLPEMRRFVDAHGVGWTTRGSDPEAVAAALREALGSRGAPELRDRLSRAAGELTWERERQGLYAVYDRLARARN